MKHSEALDNTLVNKSYECNNVRKDMEKSAEKERENLLNKSPEDSIQKSQEKILHIAITYNRTLPIIKPVIEKQFQIQRKIARITFHSLSLENKLKKIIVNFSIEHNKKNSKSRQEKLWEMFYRAYRIQEHSIVRKLLAQHPSKVHKQDLNSTSFTTSVAKVIELSIY